MGYDRHHAIIVSGNDEADVLALHRRAEEIFPWISAVSPPVTNQWRSFFVPADGSKSGWPGSKEGDRRRDRFVEALTLAEAGARGVLAWAEVQYGDDEGDNLLVRASD